MTDKNNTYYNNLPPVILPEYVKTVLERFKESGTEAYIVGGSVRDSILKIKADDYDIATPALPKQVKEIFKDFKVLETGIKHGTLTVLSQSKPIEITTYRIDKDYSDSRHPDNVEFTKDIDKDLARRDFTINAVCYSPYRGYYDPLNGIADINAEIIKAVGEPEKRFEEDALRILRGIRFAAVLGFDIDIKTHTAILKCKELLKNISKERIFSEFKKLLSGNFADTVLNNYFEVLCEGIDTLKKCSGKSFNFKGIKTLPNDTPLKIAWFTAALGEDFCFAENLLTELKCDNKTKNFVVSVLKALNFDIPKNRYDIKKLLNILEKDIFKYFHILFALDKVTENEKNAMEKTATEIFKNKECYTIKNLDIKGTDIVSLGADQKTVGQILEKLLDAVMKGACINKKANLINFAKNII